MMQKRVDRRDNLEHPDYISQFIPKGEEPPEVSFLVAQGMEHLFLVARRAQRTYLVHKFMVLISSYEPFIFPDNDVDLMIP